MRVQHFMSAIFLAALWGLNFVVVKIGLEDLPPIMFCCVRMFFVSIPAIFFIKRPRVSYKLMILYGIVVFGFQFSFLFIGMYLGVSSWLASVLFQTQVFFSLFLAVIFLQERINFKQIFGAVIAFFGVTLIALNLGGECSFLGFISIIVGAISCAFGNLLSKKITSISDIFRFIVWAGFFSWPFLLIFALYFEGGSNVIESIRFWNWNTTIALAYTVLVATFLGFYIWNWLLISYPMAIVTPFMLLIPIFSMMFAVFLLGEPLYLWKIISTLLVVLGLGINSYSTKKVTIQS